MSFPSLTGIHVHDVKGISDVDIRCAFYPNKPNFLVAPNGSGKSSLAAAFASLNRRRLKLDDASLRRGTDGSTALLEVRFSDGKTLRADCRRNEFGRAADVLVINSGLYAKQVTQYYGGHVHGQATIRVPDIELYKKVPERVSVPYSVAAYRDDFPHHVRRGVSNLAGLLKNPAFLGALVECDPKGISHKTNMDRIEAFLRVLEDAVMRNIDWKALDVSNTRIEKVLPVVSVAEILGEYIDYGNRASLLLNAVQVCRLYEKEKDAIRGADARLEYENTRREVNSLLASINTTGMELSARVDKGRLVVQLPERSSLSNGELDILNFAVSLIRAKVSLAKDLSILVIDEVFDYLDDANLMVAQHYLLKMMEHYKSLEKALYIIILTHLDPNHMESYRFRTKHISFFSGGTGGTVKDCIRSLLADRERCRRDDKMTYEDVSGRFLHYCPHKMDREETVRYLLGKGFPKAMRNPEGFRKACAEELFAYLKDEQFDVAMACCALRVCIEERAYGQLGNDDARCRFLEEHGTKEKLLLAEREGAEVPELHYLLGGLYNPCMHSSGENAAARIEMTGRALCNGVIRKMVETAVNDCDACMSAVESLRVISE